MRKRDSLFGDLRRVLWFDLALFRGRHRLLLALLGATLVPALYATIYLTSAWDPYAHLDRLPVVIANLDEGTDVRGEHVVLGAKIVEKLEQKATFKLHRVDDEHTAQHAVEHGDALFAVVVPADFSRDAITASAAAPGRIRILLSEGNSFMGATIARRFASELSTGTNEVLNEERWRVVLDTVDASKGSLDELRGGVAKLAEGTAQLDDGLARAKDGAVQLEAGARAARTGSAELADGSAKLSEGTGALTSGVAKLGGGLRTLDDALPTTTALAPLKSGAHELAEGAATLTEGIGRLAEGEAKAKKGAGDLADGTKGIPFVGKKIADGATQLQTGIAQLQDGAERAHAGARRLTDGAAKLDDGVTRLVDGVDRAHGGVHEMVTKLPTDEQLQALASGATRVADGNRALADGLSKLDQGSEALTSGVGQLSAGADRLRAGVALLSASLPAGVAGLAGDASGLASSVKPEVVALTTVGAYGNSMAPYFIGLSLWVGVVMSGFLLQLRWFPARLRGVRRLSLVLGRLAVPTSMALVQATLLVIALHVLVGVSMPSFFAIWAVALVTSATFMAVLLMLVALFGDVGKALALLLLVFQMSSSGGVFPIELSGGVFQAASSYLPFTWVIRASRAALFGAYEGAWLAALAHVAIFGMLAIAIATLCGRWKWVARHAFKPLADV